MELLRETRKKQPPTQKRQNSLHGWTFSHFLSKSSAQPLLKHTDEYTQNQ